MVIIEQPPLNGDDPAPKWRVSVTLTLRDPLFGKMPMQAGLPTVIVGPLIHRRQIVAVTRYPGNVSAWSFRFEDPRELRVLILRSWPVPASRIALPELQAVQAIVDDAPPLLPSLLRVLYAEPVTARALRWGDVAAVADALRWRPWMGARSPDALAEKKVAAAQRLGEPIAMPVTMREELDEVPETVLTIEGRLQFEEEYLPGCAWANTGRRTPRRKQRSSSRRGRSCCG